MTRLLILIALYTLPALLLGQNFPADATVVADVKNYHGSLASAATTGSWTTEKESGYLFDNMAKRVVKATTTQTAGISKNLTGLAIYVRSSVGEAWRFSRYFVTSSDIQGLKPLTQQEVTDQTVALLAANPIQVMPFYGEVAWVYGITFPDGLISETDQRSGDIIYKAVVEYEYKFISSIPFEGGLRKFRAPLDIYCRLQGSTMRVAVASVNQGEKIRETLLTEKQYNTIPVLGTRPLEELFGPDGPAVLKEQPRKAPEATQTAPNTASGSTPAPAESGGKPGIGKITKPTIKVKLPKIGG